MATVGSLVVSLAAETSAFDKGLRDGINTMRSFAASVTDTQKKIATSFNSADFGKTTISQIKKQLSARVELEDRLYNATHTGLEQQLKAHDDYYGNLKAAHQGNEGMMTLISKTAAAERQKIFEKAATQSEKSMRVMVRSMIRAGVYVYATNVLINSLTAISEANRKGENMVVAFAKSIPVIGTLTDSITGLASSLSGLNTQLEQIEKAESLNKGINTIFTELDQTIQLQSASPNERPGVQAKNWYDSKIKEIDNLEGYVKDLTIKNDKIQKQINKLKKYSESTPESVGIINFSNMYSDNTTLINPQIQKQIDALQGQKIVIPNLDALRSEAERAYKLTIESQRSERIGSITDGLKRQIETFQMSADEIAAYNAQLSGATQTELGYIQALGNKLKFLERSKKNTDGMVQEASQIQEKLNALDFEYDMLGKIGDVRERAIDQAQFQSQIEKAYINDIAKQNELMDAYLEKWDKLAKGKTGPAAFAVKFNEYAENATNMWANLGDVATNALDGMSESLTEMIISGKANFRDFARSVLADLLQMMIRSMMVQSIMAGIGYIGSMGNTANATTTAATSGAGQGSGAMSTGAQHMPGFAKGGAFSGGGVIPFAKGGIFGGMAFNSAFASGGVVGRPTVFPMANGNIGLMGEAGPEAIMPLSRGADGKLGVNAAGGGGGPANNVKIVLAMDPSELRAAMSGTAGEKIIVQAIRRNRGIVRGALG